MFNAVFAVYQKLEYSKQSGDSDPEQLKKGFFWYLSIGVNDSIQAHSTVNRVKVFRKQILQKVVAGGRSSLLVCGDDSEPAA
jgi:hypothetical protein